jgi:hypothetical protein
MLQHSHTLHRDTFPLRPCWGNTGHMCIWGLSLPLLNWTFLENSVAYISFCPAPGSQTGPSLYFCPDTVSREYPALFYTGLSPQFSGFDSHRVGNHDLF